MFRAQRAKTKTLHEQLDNKKLDRNKIKRVYVFFFVFFCLNDWADENKVGAALLGGF